jgi:hypothetical protein
MRRANASRQHVARTDLAPHAMADKKTARLQHHASVAEGMRSRKHPGWRRILRALSPRAQGTARGAQQPRTDRVDAVAEQQRVNSARSKWAGAALKLVRRNGALPVVLPCAL